MNNTPLSHYSLQKPASWCSEEGQRGDWRFGKITVMSNVRNIHQTYFGIELQWNSGIREFELGLYNPVKIVIKLGNGCGKSEVIDPSPYCVLFIHHYGQYDGWGSRWHHDTSDRKVKKMTKTSVNHSSWECHRTHFWEAKDFFF